MTPQDRKAFLEVVIGFAELKGKQLSAPGLELYWHAMQHWSMEEFRAAANHLIRTCEFMPTPKDFEDLRKASRPVPAEAWIKARGAIRSCYQITAAGAVYGTGGTCGDPLIDRAVHAIGGYAAIAQCETDKLHFLERRFTEAYEAMEDAQEVRKALPQLGNGSFALAELTKRLEQRKLVKQDAA